MELRKDGTPTPLEECVLDPDRLAKLRTGLADVIKHNKADMRQIVEQRQRATGADKPEENEGDTNE